MLILPVYIQILAECIIIIHNSLAKIKKRDFGIAISQSKKPIKTQFRGGNASRLGLLSGFSCNNSNNSSIAA